MNEPPIARHFIVCERVDRSADGRHVTLHNVIHSIRPLPGHTYPRIHPGVALYAVLTNGRGQHTLAVELLAGVGPTAASIYRTRPFTIDLGNDPLVVHGLPIRLWNLPFPSPGQYEFVLLCNDVPIAHELVELRDSR
jgi:hypothetical protein